MNVDNMTVELGVQNWKDYGLTSGDISIRLPNGTRISISSVTNDESGDAVHQKIIIHRLRGTEITIHQAGSTITKKTVRSDGHSWTQISRKVDE